MHHPMAQAHGLIILFCSKNKSLTTNALPLAHILPLTFVIESRLQTAFSLRPVLIIYGLLDDFTIDSPYDNFALNMLSYILLFVI